MAIVGKVRWYADNGEAGSVTRGEACYGAVGGVMEE